MGRSDWLERLAAAIGDFHVRDSMLAYQRVDLLLPLTRSSHIQDACSETRFANSAPLYVCCIYTYNHLALTQQQWRSASPRSSRRALPSCSLPPVSSSKGTQCLYSRLPSFINLTHILSTDTPLSRASPTRRPRNKSSPSSA